MKSWLLTGVCLLAATAAQAGIGAGSLPQKSARAAAAPVAATKANEAGDTYETALPIPTVPFTASGSTTGFADDYEVGCGLLTDESPDVVYSFIPPVAGYYAFSLCGSAYDTKLAFIYYDYTIVACNDDFGDGDIGGPCELDSRLEGVWCDNHNVYYLVIDGFRGENGDYTLSVTNDTHCGISTPPGDSLPEGEPALTSGSTDDYNCGCGCDGAPLTVAVPADDSGNATVLVTGGWRDWAVSDFDWFRFTAGASGSVHVEVECEVDILCALYDGTDCQGDWNVESHVLQACGPGSYDFAVTAGADFLVQLHVLDMVPPLGLAPFETPILLQVSGLSSAQPVELTTWGALKSTWR